MRWIVLRGLDNWTMGECEAKGEDLGAKSHVLKVLSETFRGCTVFGDDVAWKTSGAEVHFHIGSHARVQRIVVEVNSTDIDSMVVAVSTKLRALRDRRQWRFFESDSRKPIRLAKSKWRRRSTNGQVTVELTQEKLVKQLTAGRKGTHVFFGGFSEGDAVEKYLHEFEIPDAETPNLEGGMWGYTNLEIQAPDGIRYFEIHFAGPPHEKLRDLFCAEAERHGYRVAEATAQELQIRGGHGPAVPLIKCRALMHHVWADSTTPAEQHVPPDAPASAASPLQQGRG